MPTLVNRLFPKENQFSSQEFYLDEHKRVICGHDYWGRFISSGELFVTILPGVSIWDASESLCYVAQNLNTCVTSEFNGVKLYAYPTDLTSDVTSRYFDNK